MCVLRYGWHIDMTVGVRRRPPVPPLISDLKNRKRLLTERTVTRIEHDNHPVSRDSCFCE